MSDLIVVQDLVAGYQGGFCLQRVTFSVAPGQWIFVRGDNGSGKTTLLKALAGTLSLYSGTIQLAAHDISRTSVDRRVELGIGYLRQTHNIFLDIRAKDFLRIAYRGSNSNFQGRLKWITSYFPQVKDFFDSYGGLLSGGQRQVLAISAILMNPKRLLLLDEPTAGIAEATSIAIREAINQLVDQEGLAVITIDHCPTNLTNMGHRFLTMNGGALNCDAIVERPDI